MVSENSWPPSLLRRRVACALFLIAAPLPLSFRVEEGKEFDLPPLLDVKNRSSHENNNFCRLRRACRLRRVCCRRVSGGGAALPMARRGMAAEAGQQSARLCCGAEWGHTRPYARRSAGAQSRSIACPLSERSSTGAGGAAGGQCGKDVSPAPPPANPRAVCPRTASAPAAACPRCCCFPQPVLFTTPLLLAPLLLPFLPLMRPCCICC